MSLLNQLQKGYIPIDFGVWQAENEDNLWAAFNETNAIAEGVDYDDFCGNEYDNSMVARTV